MRKYISMIMFGALAAFGFSACDVETDEEAGGTNVVQMAGFWDVTIDIIDDAGNILDADPYGIGTTTLMTYNTVANVNTEMWLKLNGQGEFWDMQLIVPINYGAKTFACGPTVCEAGNADAPQVTITDGKVLLGQGHNLHGLPTDSIVFTAKFDDPQDNQTYRIAGIKHSGFTE